MKIKGLLKILLEMLLMFFLFYVCEMAGMKKYVIVGGFCAAFFVAGRKKKWSVDELICIALPVITYLLIGCLSSLLNASIYLSTVKIVVFWMLPLVLVFSLYTLYGEKMTHIIDIQFLCSAAAYVVTYGRFLMKSFNVESTFAFAFGAFFVYYVYKKKWHFSVIAALFLYFTDKRIVVLAIAAAVAVMFFLKLFRNDKKLVYVIWGIVSTAVLSYIWLICSGTFEYYCKGIGINTNGRVFIYDRITEWAGENVLLFGKGLGIVEELLEVWNMKAFANLHNDLLKFYLELGCIGLCLFLFSYLVMFFFAGRRFGKQKMSFLLAMTIYSIVLFATDNVSIYILYLIPVYSICFAVLSERTEIEIKGNV